MKPFMPLLGAAYIVPENGSGIAVSAWTSSMPIPWVVYEPIPSLLVGPSKYPAHPLFDVVSR